MVVKKVTFANFLKLFPIIDLPVTLDHEVHHVFSKENKPLAPQLIETFILPHEGGTQDEFTEYIPCFRLPEQPQFHALVYWKAELMNYSYVMMTYDQKGAFIKAYHIGGTKTDGHSMAQLLCTIHPNLQIDLAAGTSSIGESTYNPTDTKVFKIQLLEDGTADIEMEEDIWL